MLHVFHRPKRTRAINRPQATVSRLWNKSCRAGNVFSRTGALSLPYARLNYKSDKALLQDLLRMVREESVTAVVLGVPRLLDGKETTMTRRILAFGEKLEAALKPVPLYRQDESLSSFEAEERMKSSPRYNFKVDPRQIDSLAAVIILEDFIKQQKQ